MNEKTCTNEQKVLVHLNPTTAAGNPVGLDGPVTVEIQSGDGTAEVQADGLSFFAISGSNPGDTVYLISADADLGSGVENITDVFTLHVEGAKAANLGVVVDEPVLK